MTAVSGKKNGQNFSGSYTYDKAGNPTSYFNPGDLSTWTLSWKNGRELGKAVKSGTTLSFDYDVNGLRTWKQVLKTAVSKKKIAQYTAKIAAQKCGAIKSALRTVGAGLSANYLNTKLERLHQWSERLF